MAYTFGYPRIYVNGINNNSQLRRSTDMIYQRGATYEVTLTGNTYIPSMELDVDIYLDVDTNNNVITSNRESRLQVVPYKTEKVGSIYYYYFNIRPYDFLSNYLETEHYQYYWLNDWFTTNTDINIDNKYKNMILVNFKYGWRYTASNGAAVTEYTTLPTNNFNHFTDLNFCDDATCVPSGFTNTGPYFNYIGGQSQMQDRYILQNFDQEIGTTIGNGINLNTPNVNRLLNPVSQYMLSYPTFPYLSETGRFLTDAPRIQYIQSDENYVLYYLGGQTGDRQVSEAELAVFEFFDVDNNRINYVDIDLYNGDSNLDTLTGFTPSLSMKKLPCGPKDIDNLFITVNWDNVAYYRVQIFTTIHCFTCEEANGPLCPASESFFFYIETNCGPENTRLTFLNERGGYDYYTFTRYRQDVKKISRQTYDSRYYATDLSSPDRNIGRTVKTFATDVDREFVLESDWLSVPMGNWLEQLFLSPQVYEMRPDFISPIDRQDKIYKDLRPVQVLSTEVETITKNHRKLNKYKITLKYATTYFTNKGF